jgi:hypothetical protein
MKFERVLSFDEKRGLRGSVFRDRHLAGIDFGGADLQSALFLGVELRSCSFEGADLRGARFIVCILHDVVFSRARFGENLFDGTTLTEIGGLSEEQRRQVVQSGGAFVPRLAVAWGRATRRLIAG